MPGPAFTAPSTTIGAMLFGLAVASAHAQDRSTTGGRKPILTLPKILPECLPSTGDEGDDEEIIICANPREQQRYRLRRQAWDPNGATPSVSRERHSLYEQGDAGIGSCSTVGPGGWTGCALRSWKAAREQHGR
jgi:hypothetical protein